MSDNKTIGWAPAARSGEPHPFEPDGMTRWCNREGCEYDVTAYVHAPEAERLAFDAEQALKTAPESTEPITSRELTRTLHMHLALALSPAVLRLGNITGVSGRRGYGEFVVTMPSTGQRFRISVAEMAS